MKYKTKILLLLSAFAVAAAPMISYGAETKEQKEARLKAEKAERELKQANAKKVNELYQQFYKSFQNDPERTKKILDEIVGMVGVPGGPDIQRVYGFHTNLIRNEKAAEYKEYLKGFYEKMLTMTAGDLKAQNYQDYADFLKKNKMADEKKTAELLASRYQVKDVSGKKLVEMYAADLELEKADAVAQKWLAEQKDSKGRINVTSHLAKNVFSKYKVYGSVFADKYAKLWLAELKDSPADMISAIHWYAPYARQYALITDAEYDKLMASRYTLPGAASKDINNAYCFDIIREAGSVEREELFKKATAAAKTSRERIEVYKAVSRKPYHGAPDLKILPQLLEKALTEEESLYTDRWVMRDIVNSYVGCSDLRFAEAEKFLNDLAVKAIKRASDLTAKIKAAEQAFEKFKDGEFKTMKDRTQASKLHQEKTAFVRDLKAQQNVVNDALVSIYSALSNLEKKHAVRYYDDPNPVLLKRAIDARQKLANFLPADNMNGKLEQQREMVLLALDSQDYALVRKIAGEILSVKDPKFEKHNALIWAKYALGFAAYEEEDYAKAIEILLPMTERNDYNFNERLYDNIVRSYVALGQYDEALKYTDKMVQSAKWFMRERLKQQVEELKERAKEKAAKK